MPREDVRRGGLTDAHFAAQLDKVVRNPSDYPIYGDPTEFFALTYPTAGLRELLTSTFGRLSGRAGEVPGAEHGVVRFQTSFGGGKTHGLIAAYHLATGARPFNVSEFVDVDLLPENARVAAVVGDSLDAVAGTDIAGKRPQTMWGAIAAQLGPEAWPLIERHDLARTTPSSAVWEEVLSTVPTLVIIDEIAAHMRALASSGDPDVRRQAEAMPAFLFNLATAAASVSTTRLIITLATTNNAFGAETEQVERLLDSGSGAQVENQSVLDRFKEILVPAADDEIAEILRRRLFASIDESAAAETAREFAAYYADLEGRGTELGWGPDIAARIERSYPLHPELVSVLDARIGNIPEFQRTRGALRLLAEAVYAIWAADADLPIINLGDLPLDAAPVTTAMTKAIGRDGYAQVANADIAGGSSHAADVDRTRFPATSPYATPAATAVFIHSLEHTASSGATLVDAWRATLAPGRDPDHVEEALTLLEQRAWHLSYDGSRYRFQTEPNATKIVADELAAVQPSMVREELDRRIKGIFPKTGPITPVLFPTGPEDIDDRPELRLGILHYDDLTVRTATASPPNTRLLDMLDTTGASGANRVHRNAVTFLVADTNQVEAMRRSVAYHIAAQRISGDTGRMDGYEPEVRRKLREIADKAGLDARISITRCYRHLFYPKADKANHHLRHHELPLTRQGEQDRAQTEVIRATLENLGKIRTKALATDYLAAKAGFPATDPIATDKAANAFWRDHDADLILDVTLLIDAIVSGVRNGTWVYYDAETERAWGADTAPPAPRIAATTWLYDLATAHADGLLGRDPTWDDVEKVIARRNAVTGSELRSDLETVLGREPTKKSILEVLSRAARHDPPRVVVVDGPAAGGAKVLAPSTIEGLGLDRLTVLTVAWAESLGIEPVVRSGGFSHTERGSSGQAFARLGDKLAEYGTETRVGHVTITITADTPATGEIRTLLAAPGQLPRHTFTTGLDGTATFPGITGDVTFAITAPSKDLQSIEKRILDLCDMADDLAMTLTLDHTPNEPLDPTGAEWRTLVDTITRLHPGHMSLTVKGQR